MRSVSIRREDSAGLPIPQEPHVSYQPLKRLASCFIDDLWRLQPTALAVIGFHRLQIGLPHPYYLRPAIPFGFTGYWTRYAYILTSVYR
jgi:hypothetical protein